MNISPTSNFRHSSIGRAALRATGMALAVSLASGMAAADVEPLVATAPATTAPTPVTAAALDAESSPAAESAERVRAAAETLLRKQLQNVVYRVYVHATGPDARLHLGRCPVPLAASLATGAEPSAHMNVRVSCTSARLTWAVFVPVTIESDVDVLVLRESAVRGARLTAAQVSGETRRVSGLAVGYVTDMNVLPRYTLMRSLPAGSVLTADALQADYLVRQGQEVTLVAATPGISVRATGKALEDGREGARVRVQNLASLKVVQGVVDPSGVIEVTP
jgi:flagellar basal body P-ring formation protein FlgA